MRFAALLKKIREIESRRRSTAPSGDLPDDVQEKEVSESPRDSSDTKSNIDSSAVPSKPKESFSDIPPEAWISDLEDYPDLALPDDESADSDAPHTDILDRVESSLHKNVKEDTAVLAVDEDSKPEQLVTESSEAEKIETDFSEPESVQLEAIESEMDEEEEAELDHVSESDVIEPEAVVPEQEISESEQAQLDAIELEMAASESVQTDVEDEIESVSESVVIEPEPVAPTEIESLQENVEEEPSPLTEEEQAQIDAIELEMAESEALHVDVEEETASFSEAEAETEPSDLESIASEFDALDETEVASGEATVADDLQPEPMEVDETSDTDMVEVEGKVNDLLGDLDAPEDPDAEPELPVDDHDVLDDEVITELISKKEEVSESGRIDVEAKDEEELSSPPADEETTLSDSSVISELESVSEDIQQDITDGIRQQTSEKEIESIESEETVPVAHDAEIPDAIDLPQDQKDDDSSLPEQADEALSPFSDDTMVLRAKSQQEQEEAVHEAEVEAIEASSHDTVLPEQDVDSAFEDVGVNQEPDSLDDQLSDAQDMLDDPDNTEESSSSDGFDFSQDPASSGDVEREVSQELLDRLLGDAGDDDMVDIDIEQEPVIEDMLSAKATVLIPVEETQNVLGPWYEESASDIPDSPEKQTVLNDMFDAPQPEQQEDALNRLLDIAMQQANQAGAESSSEQRYSASASASATRSRTSSDRLPAISGAHQYRESTVEMLLSLLNERQRELQMKIEAIHSRLDTPSSQVERMDQLLESMEEQEIEDILVKLANGDIEKDEIPQGLLDLLEAVHDEDMETKFELQQTILHDEALLQEGDTLDDWQSSFDTDDSQDLSQTLVTSDADVGVGDDLKDWEHQIGDLDSDSQDSQDLDGQVTDTEGDITDAPAAEVDEVEEPQREPDEFDDLLAAVNATDDSGDDASDDDDEDGDLVAVADSELSEEEYEVNYDKLDSFFKQIDDNDEADADGETGDVITRLMGKAVRSSPLEEAGISTGPQQSRVIQPKPLEEFKGDILDLNFDEFEFVEDEEITAEKESLLDLQTLQSILGSEEDDEEDVEKVQVPDFTALKQLGEREETTIVVSGPVAWYMKPVHILFLLFRMLLSLPVTWYKKFNKKLEEFFPKTGGHLFRPIPFRPALRDVVGACGIFLVVSMTFLIVKYISLAFM